MILRSSRSFGRDSPVHAYWLSCCEGFTVRANGRAVGVVEAVVSTEPVTGADELVVRRRGPLRQASVLAAERVEAVVPAQRVLVLAPRAHRRPVSPVIRRGVARAAVSTAVGVRAGAVFLAPILVRAAAIASLVALRLVELAARALATTLRHTFRLTFLGLRSARARAPLVCRSLARLAMPPSRTQ